MATSSSRCGPRSRGGFTLVELLVGVVIGMLGIIVMFQVSTLWESLKRTTATGSDAQIAGSVAMFHLERDIRPAGMGFGHGVDGVSVPSIGCAVSPAGFPMVPVLIVHHATGAPDEIISLYGNSSFFVSTQKFKASTLTLKTVDGSSAGFRINDWVIAGGQSSAVPCVLLKITASNAGVLTHPASIATPPSGYLYNLGPGPQRVVWTVDDRKLMRQELLSGARPTQVADNVIDLRAQYGLDGVGGGSADDGVLDAEDWTEDPPSPTDWTKLLAIRVALLSRSQQFERTEVTATAPQWSGGEFDMTKSTALAGEAGDVGDWKHYRYRVYEKVIPLRNMVWGGSFR